ncbi:hypothetical protein ACFPYJ_00075 [Paenibacillus solisilvae]|uniref:Phage protein n=1 Tax=Paenibacillus solisilvae TaxID=2486751 RepID=A0ABW0VNS8_9BACL
MRIDKLILATFAFEENTIFHVENHLFHNEFNLTRSEIKARIVECLNMGYLKIYDDPSEGQIKFQDSIEEFEEDYWFVLTKEGKRQLKSYGRTQLLP